jgi:hypothetical protein
VEHLDLEIGLGLGLCLELVLCCGLDLDLGPGLYLDLYLSHTGTDPFDLAPFHPNVRKLPWQWGSWGCGDTLRG